MCGFDIDAVDTTYEMIGELDKINFQIAELKEIKEKIERKVIDNLKLATFDESGNVTSVQHDGEQTKLIGKYKVKIKTPSLWKILKSEYEASAPFMRKEFDPVKTSVSYRVDKKTLENIKTFGSQADQLMLNRFLVLDYSKPSLTLTLNA